MPDFWIALDQLCQSGEEVFAQTHKILQKLCQFNLGGYLEQACSYFDAHSTVVTCLLSNLSVFSRYIMQSFLSGHN